MHRLPLIVLAGSVLAASAAIAQDRQSAAVPPGMKPGASKPGGTRPGGTPPGGLAPGMAPGMGPGAGPKSALRSWAKLCETPTVAGTDLLGKPSVTGVKTCLVHHEQIDTVSGAVRVAAGVEQTEGQQTLVIKVQPGVDQAPGLRLMIMPRDIWQKLQMRLQVPPQQAAKIRRLTLSYSGCTVEGCLAETPATQELVKDLKTGGGMVIVTTKARAAFAYSVPLNGFREAFDGPPVDSVRFLTARAELLRQIRERQKLGLQPPQAPGGAPGIGVPPGLPGGTPGAVAPPGGGGQGIPPGVPGDGQGGMPPKRPGDDLPGRPGAGEQDI